MERAEATAIITRHCRTAGSGVLFDEAATTLYDLRVNRSLAIDLGRIKRAEAHSNRETSQPYLALLRDDGRQLFLTEFGIAFDPMPVNAALALPPVVCLRDFYTAISRIDHLLTAHPEAEGGKNALDAVSLSLSILGAARAIGFDVSREERELDARLAAIESAR